MRSGALLSGVFHAVVITVLVLGLPSFIEPPMETVVPVEMIAFEEELPKPEPQPEPKPKVTAPEPAPEPEPPVQEAKVTPEPPPPEPPKPEPEVAPEPPVPEAKLKPEPEPEPLPEPPEPEAKPEPEPQPQQAVQEPPKPKRRPAVEPPKPKQPEKAPEPKVDRFASILRNVEKLKEQPKPPQPEQPPVAPAPGPEARPVSALEQNDMVRAIQQQLVRCWRLDPGALEAHDMVVEIHVLLNPDGSLRKAEVVDVMRMVSDGYFRSAAENAKRAIYKCSPFDLPPRRYEVWRELTLRFNPREMFGT